MEKAKKECAAYAQEFNKVNELTDEDRQSLKIEINTILHTYLPSNRTVGDVETLAFVIFNMIVDPDEYLTK